MPLACRAATKVLHFCLSFAILLTVPQVLFMVFISPSTVRLHVLFGLPRLRFPCPSFYPLSFSWPIIAFLTKSNTMGAASGEGTAYSSQASDFVPVFMWSSCYSFCSNTCLHVLSACYDVLCKIHIKTMFILFIFTPICFVRGSCYIYSQTCIKRSPLGQRNSGL